jgi:hypothetical protein
VESTRDVNKTATGSAGLAVDLELADEVEVVSFYGEALRDVVRTSSRGQE